MTRVKRGYVAKKRRKSILEITSGNKRAHSRLYRVAQQQAMKGLVYSHLDRKRRKRDFSSLWITRINAASRKQGISYSKVISKFHKAGIQLNRKILAQIAIFDTQTFSTILNKIN